MRERVLVLGIFDLETVETAFSVDLSQSRLAFKGSLAEGTFRILDDVLIFAQNVRYMIVSEQCHLRRRSAESSAHSGFNLSATDCSVHCVQKSGSSERVTDSFRTNRNFRTSNFSFGDEKQNLRGEKLSVVRSAREQNTVQTKYSDVEAV